MGSVPHRQSLDFVAKLNLDINEAPKIEFIWCLFAVS
jgi:hypothetical protein